VLRDASLPLFGPTEIEQLRKASVELQTADGEGRRELGESLGKIQKKIERLSLTGDSGELRARLAKARELPLHDFLAQLQELVDPETRLLFICDQFEELFVHFADTPEMQEFVTGLGEAWKDDRLNIRILFSMREDWVGSMIEFRTVIPEIFTHAYKLNPLHQSKAGAVLQYPLKRFDIALGDDTRTAILGDLARSYSLNQVNRFNNISLTPSPAKDPFIELPALQIVADELWDTRQRCTAPFTLDHYRQLPRLAPLPDNGEFVPGGGGKGGPTPADWVLGHYLPELLDQLAAQEGSDAGLLREVRLDVLYLLTDKVRHRRALSEEMLLRELPQIRPPRLDLPAVDAALLARAIGPLEQQRLVRVFPSAGGLKQYELAHDFAVRAVVADWRQLERRRIEALALRAREDQEKEDRLGRLEGQESLAVRYLRALSLFPVALCFLTALAIWLELFTELPILRLAFLGTGLLLLPVALLARQRIAALLGAACLAAWLIADFAGQELDFADAELVAFFTVVFLGLGFGGIPATIAAVRQGEQRTKARQPLLRRLSILLAESVDLLGVVGLALYGAIVGVLLREESTGLQRMPALVAGLAGGWVGVAAWIFYTARRLKKKGATPGFALAGLRLESPDTEQSELSESFRRQLQFALLALLSAAVWPIIVIRDARVGDGRRRPYETGAGFEVRDADPREPHRKWLLVALTAVFLVVGAGALVALLVFEPIDVPVTSPLDIGATTTSEPASADTTVTDYFSPLMHQLTRLGAEQYSFHDARGRYARSLKELEFSPGDGVDVELEPDRNGWSAKATIRGSDLTCSMTVREAPVHGMPLPPVSCQRLANYQSIQSVP
jgi:hypothetical protein